MKPPAKTLRDERDATDASLLVERAKTDDELEGRRAAIEEEAARVVEVARERAEELLRAARARTDQHLKGDADPQLARQLGAERANEDLVLAEERAVAEQQLETERTESERALSNLLRFERESTDERLLLERDKADESLATRDEFLGMVSHDLRTLLGGIALSASLLGQQADVQSEAGAATRRHVERIQRFAARTNRLVGDLLDIVSLEAGGIGVVPQMHDVVQLVHEAVDAFQPAYAAKGVALTSSSVTSSLLAIFDHDRILQVLANLLSNALKFTDRGSVVVSVAPHGAGVQVSVTDTGIGIPAEQTEAVFERFRQVKTHDRRGLGLGLYIAKCVLDAHGGRIWAERLEAGGTSFHFTLPESEQPAA